MTLALTLVMLGQAGDRPAYKVREAPKIKATTPVTRAEARAVFVRLQGIGDRAVGKSYGAAVPAFAASAAPVTSALVTAELTRLTDRYRRDFKRVPASLGSKPGVKALRLISPTGPLALNRPTLTTAEFGDAVGYFLVRLADLTHIPSHRFSPNTMPDQ